MTKLARKPEHGPITEMLLGMVDVAIYVGNVGEGIHRARLVKSADSKTSDIIPSKSRKAKRGNHD